jgi:hypothetical protein
MPGGPDQPFIIRFSTILHKEQFLKRYFVLSKELTLKKLGMKENTGIYIQQNLTSNNYKIFRLALEYKKLGKIDKVRIVDFGVISVKATGRSNFLLVKDVTELKELCINADKNKATNSTKN